MSRPTTFNQDIADQVLMRMRNGETLKRICSDLDMPSTNTVWEWQNAGLGAPTTWRDVYARARLDQADGFAADILNIADGSDDISLASAIQAVEALPADATDTEKRRAYFHANKRSLEESKMRIDARKWTAARMHPSRWGDSVTLNHTTNPGDEPVKLDLGLMSTDQLEVIAKVQAQLARGPDEGTPTSVPIKSSEPVESGPSDD